MRTLLHTLILAGSYCLLGVAGLQLAIDPGYASAIFPAAGVGFAAVLQAGYRLLPGIWLGSAGVNLWIAWSQGFLSAKAVLLAAVIAVGAMLQAWLAAYWVRKRLKDDWRRLDQDAAILEFLLLAGPVASLISASWGNLALYLFHAISSHELLFNWSNWWVGDTLGVLLFSPLALMVLQWQCPLWRSRLTSVALPTLMAAAVILFAFVYVSEKESQAIKQHIARRGHTIADQLLSQIASYQEVVVALGSFVDVLPEHSLAEFQRFTRQTFINHPDLQALSWNLLITHERRQAYEAAIAQAFGGTDFQISQRDAAGRRVPAASRHNYVVVQHISPMEGNAQALGYDIASEPVRRQAIEHAAQTGQLSMTAPIRLVQEQANSMGVLLLEPVYREQSDAAGGAYALHGFAVGVLRLDTLLARGGVKNLPAGVGLTLWDTAAPAGSQPLFTTRHDQQAQINEYAWVSEIPIGGRVWRISLNPTPEYFAANRSLLAWVVLAAGLALASLLQAFLLAMTGRASVIQSRVAEQTQMLAEQERFLRLSQSDGGIGTWEADLLNNQQIWSENCIDILGFPPLDEPRWEDFLNAVHPEDRRRVMKAMQSHLDSGAKYEVEYRITSGSGEIRWMRSAGQVERDAAGKPLLMRGIVQEITDRKQAEAKLVDSERQLRFVTDHAPILIAQYDHEKRYKFVNQPYAALFGLQPEDIIGKQALEVLSEQDFARAKPRMDAVLAGRESEYDLELTGTQRESQVVSVHYVPERDAEGRVVGFIAAISDITERKQAEHRQRIAAVAFESQEGMVITDAEGKILRVNKAFTDITGYSAEDVIGQNPRMLRSGKHDAFFYTEMWKSLRESGKWDGEIWNRRKNGEVYPEHLMITAVKEPGGGISNYVATLTDITLSKAAAQEIESLAFFDPLTGLPNRRLLQDRLQRALSSSARSGKKGALLFIDLDKFKMLNDTLGHDVGDLLLQQVAERLSACVREGDTVARLGGDEFVVMLENLNVQLQEAATQTESIGNKILARITQPYQLGAHHYVNGSSIGIVLFNDHEQPTEELLRHADIAMYEAKSGGGNAVRFFDPGMQASIVARAELERELRQALDERQFQLYYQLQVNSSRQSLGAEALLRWRHPKRGLISPNQFIALAEEAGLILPIGHWVLETACAQLKAWQQSAATRHLTLSVNVSAEQFRQADFVSQVQSVLKHHALGPSLLKLELTESMLLDNVDATIAAMTELQAMGVRFSLDDFGTGYSSLQYLKRLPLQELKIDQSFVRDIAVDPSDRVLVRTIISMAQSLELSVIAEGVETEQQRDILFSQGCTHYQGYLIGKPVPIQEFEALLKQA